MPSFSISSTLYQILGMSSLKVISFFVGDKYVRSIITDRVFILVLLLRMRLELRKQYGDAHGGESGVIHIL